MINLFEYQNKATLEASLEGLEGFLDKIWNNRESKSVYFEDENSEIGPQKFLNLFHKSSKIKSNKYVGVIHYQGQIINLLPKIFYDSGKDYAEDTEELKNDLSQIHNHVLWWLSYCRKIKFPNYQVAMGSSRSNFFEVLIYLFSKYTRELLSSSIYQQYEEVNSELTFIKGKLNVNTYLTENLSKGKWHKINCTYDAFVLDNEFNRVIKYVTTLLFNVTSNQENKRNLREILFLLDEVSEERATAEICSKITFNPMFSEFETVRDYCYLFLSNCVSFDYKSDLKLFAFLLPMEYVFEDFIFGFIDKEIESVKAKSQIRNRFLDEGKVFNLRPDLWLKVGPKALIADTKYKIVYSDGKDPKNGISQNDLYQMLAYAVRFEVEELILFYPETIRDVQDNLSVIIIKDTLANKEIIIKAFQLPVINRELFKQKLNTKSNLKELFELTRVKLIEKIEEILLPQTL